MDRTIRRTHSEGCSVVEPNVVLLNILLPGKTNTKEFSLDTTIAQVFTALETIPEIKAYTHNDLFLPGYGIWLKPHRKLSSYYLQKLVSL